MISPEIEDHFDFLYNPTGDVAFCKECGLEVHEHFMATHVKWHQAISELLEASRAELYSVEHYQRGFPSS